MRIKRKLKFMVVSMTGNKDYNKLVVLGKQRTGSSLVVTLLRSHPHIELKGEAFRLLENKSCRTIWDENFGRKLPWVKYMGFKIFYHHPDDSDDREVWDLIKQDHEIRIIHIKRNNLLRTYVSKLIAEKTGAWRSPSEKRDGHIEKQVTVDTEHCINSLKKTIQWEDQYGKKMFPNHPYMEITYEELISNLQGTMNNIMAFLNVKQKKVKSILKKQNPEPLKDLVTNYHELVTALEKTEFNHLIEE